MHSLETALFVLKTHAVAEVWTADSPSHPEDLALGHVTLYAMYTRPRLLSSTTMPIKTSGV